MVTFIFGAEFLTSVGVSFGGFFLSDFSTFGSAALDCSY